LSYQIGFGIQILGVFSRAAVNRACSIFIFMFCHLG
jgi:hypothetical protein